MEGVCVWGFRSSLPSLTAPPALSRVMFSQQCCCADAAGGGPAQPQGAVFIVSTTYICLLKTRQLAQAPLFKIKTPTPASSWLCMFSIDPILRNVRIKSLLSAFAVYFLYFETLLTAKRSHSLIRP